MNKVILLGRLTRDPETRYTADSKAITKYSIAVNRRFSREGQPDADFINIVAFNKDGEFAEKYFKKGMQVSVVGRIQTGSFTDKDGNKRYTTDVVVEEQHFAESKRDAKEEKQEQKQEGFVPIDNIDDDSLPF